MVYMMHFPSFHYDGIVSIQVLKQRSRGPERMDRTGGMTWRNNARTYWPGGTSPKTPVWGESTQSSTYVHVLACFNIIMHYNQLQYAERENTWAGTANLNKWEKFWQEYWFHVDEAQKIQGFTFCMSCARTCKMVSNLQGFLSSKLDTLGELDLDIW